MPTSQSTPQGSPFHLEPPDLASGTPNAELRIDPLPHNFLNYVPQYHYNRASDLFYDFNLPPLNVHRDSFLPTLENLPPHGLIFDLPYEWQDGFVGPSRPAVQKIREVMARPTPYLKMF